MSSSVRDWIKVAEWLEARGDLPKSNERVQPSSYLEVREGVRKTSFRVAFRQGDINLRTVLGEEFKEWRPAQKEAERLIFNAKNAEKPKGPALVRSEELCDEIVALKQSKSPATYEQAEIFFRLHLKPFLNEHCPYASELNATVWLRYKNWVRLKDPTVALFNHWKFFVQLGRYAFDKGVISQRLKLEFNEEREDNRARGLVIPDADFSLIVEAATPKYFGKLDRVQPKWRDRILLQRLTGMRPGEVRCLRKDRWDPAARVITLEKEDTKTRSARSFAVVADEAIEILTRRLVHSPGPFFFSNEAHDDRPMDKHLNGWKAILKKAKVNASYTPHDLRHTYLTQMFKTTANPALICYQAGLSLEEAQKTYLHFTAADTQAIALMASTQVRHNFSNPVTNSSQDSKTVGTYNEI